MIDFEALSQAFAPITEVGRGETTLEVGGNRVTLRTLLPEEDAAVLRVSSQVLRASADAEDKVEKHVMATYLDTFRVEALSHAIVQINDLDLRGVEYVATGEKTESGKAVRVARHVAIRDLITKKQPWSTVMRTMAYDAYANLLEKNEQLAEKLVEWDPSDLRAEIERVEKRLADLNRTLDDRTKGDPNLMVDQVEAIRQYDENNRRAAGRGSPARAPQEAPSSPAASHEQPMPAPAPPPQVPVEPEWADFDNNMPVASDLHDAPVESELLQDPVQVVRATPRQPVLPSTSAPPSGVGPRPLPPTEPLGDVMDSFSDPSDHAALVAEQDRIIAARRQMLMEQQQSARAGAMSATHRPTPPHLRGRQPVEEIPSGPTIEPVPGIDGVPAFQLSGQAQELSARGRGRPSAPKPEQGDGSNPKFRPPKG